VLMNSTPQGLSHFRRAILDAIAAVKLQKPQSYIHLVYAPELADPLELVGERKREVALIKPSVPNVTGWSEEALPRIITLDCRRVAAYMLETDPGIDDPLMESSISQSYAETILQQRVNILQTNDDAGLAERAVCGWIVSTETAAQISRRINSSSCSIDINRRKYWVRWYNPDYLDVLWPTLTDSQQHNLLGQDVWIAHDEKGTLKKYSYEHETALSQLPQVAVRLDSMQWSHLENVPLVQRLLQQWHGLSQETARPVQPDAQEQLHKWVHRARQSGLDGEDIAVYAIAAMQMPSGLAEAPEFIEAVKNAVQQGDKLSQSLPALLDRYWTNAALKQQAH
jgi:transposase-like protein